MYSEELELRMEANLKAFNEMLNEELASGTRCPECWSLHMEDTDKGRICLECEHRKHLFKTNKNLKDLGAAYFKALDNPKPKVKKVHNKRVLKPNLNIEEALEKIKSHGYKFKNGYFYSPRGIQRAYQCIKKHKWVSLQCFDSIYNVYVDYDKNITRITHSPNKYAAVGTACDIVEALDLLLKAGYLYKGRSFYDVRTSKRIRPKYFDGKANLSIHTGGNRYVVVFSQGEILSITRYKG